MSRDIMLELRNVSRVFIDKTRSIKVLENVHLKVGRGENSPL